jgi:hypothetical protein
VVPFVIFLGCKPAPGTVVPAAAVPLTPAQVLPWVMATVPTGSSIRQFKWLFQDDRSSAGGDGRARLAAPDTLRFDARGPLGTGRMAALVVGDAPVWAVPEEVVGQIVPDYTLFWAMFGVALVPAPNPVHPTIVGNHGAGRFSPCWAVGTLIASVRLHRCVGAAVPVGLPVPGRSRKDQAACSTS